MDLVVTSWAANLLTAGIIIAVLGYWLKRYIDFNDRKHDKHTSEIREVQLNYNQKFKDIHKKLDEVEDRITERITTEVRHLSKDGAAMGRDVARLEAKVDGIFNHIKSNRHG